MNDLELENLLNDIVDEPKPESPTARLLLIAGPVILVWLAF